MLREYQWPLEVSVLTASDLRRHGSTFKDGKACLMGWAVHDRLAWKWMDPSSPMWEPLRECAEELGLYSYEDPCWGPIDINDDPQNSFELLARCYNRATAKLGYRLNNPEVSRKGNLLSPRDPKSRRKAKAHK